ncbi:hypothetical protein [Alicyclobacillus dauci]|uniref:Uncharacterized protein n=1 Tax=Alicyclobacillus dauci TaxID=1475485 RepID=A0ABY6YWW8_9BACL|nr:hypothetical protein [Alicyclobacillus dauci]WAH35033.1 hypothetical protein NZD86_11905 [Alicyclobacillus dauci]
MKKVGLPADDKDYVYDSLTGLVTEWVTVPPPSKPKRDPLDQWYEEFTEREFGKAITTADTLERKHGALRPKRYAMVR